LSQIIQSDQSEAVLTPVLPGDLIQVEDRSSSRAFTALEIIGYERNNIAEMRVGRNRHEPMVSSETWREVDGKHAHLSASQRAAVEQIVSGQDKIAGLESVAGAGKTTSLAAARNPDH
jgi:superfamily I DNA and RNA helicase